MYTSIKARIFALLLSIAATFACVRSIAVYALPPPPTAEAQLALVPAPPSPQVTRLAATTNASTTSLSGEQP